MVTPMCPPVPGDPMQLVLDSDPRNLGVVRAMVERHAGLAGFDERARHRIALAVDEACANVIRHAYCGRTDGELTVACAIQVTGESACLVVTVRDRGLAAMGGCLEPVPASSMEYFETGRPRGDRLQRRQTALSVFARS